MRSRVRWFFVNVLGYTPPLPKPRQTFREDVQAVGTHLMAGGSGAPAREGLEDDRAQREYLEWVASL